MPKENRPNIKRLTTIAVFVALALVLFLVEMLIPALPFDAKIGLANIVTMLAIILLGVFDAAVIVVVKCIISGIFSGRLMGFLYSLSGGIASLLVMALLYELVFPKVGVIGISLAGALVHVFTQVMIGVALLNQINIITLLPYLMLISIAAGIFVGAVVFFLIKYLPKNTINRYFLRNIKSPANTNNTGE